MIKINSDITEVERYPGGEQRLSLEVEAGTPYMAEWRYEREEELTTLVYLCSHIKAQGGILNVLYIPYLPNARMDRVKTISEVFTLKYLCSLINSLGFAKVYVNNPHSDVCMGILNNAQDAYLIND